MSKNFSAKDGANTDIAGGVVNFDSSIVVAVDGSLTPIATDFTASDPTASTAGASTSPYSTPFLLRWIVKGLQAVFSKFSAGVALSDADANPTTTSVGAKGQLWDGSQWVRARQAVTGPITSLLGITPAIVLGRYNATVSPLTNGDYSAIQLSRNAELITANIDLSGALTSITAADTGSTVVTGQSNQSIITGTPTAGSVVAIACSGDSSFAARVSGTFVGTLQFERSTDGVSWTPISADVSGTNVNVSQITAIGSFHGNASSCTGIRVRCLSLTSGSPSVQLLTGAGVNTIRIGNPLRLIDPGSGVTATIKAASTPATATDTAIVVSQRDPIPLGSSVSTLIPRSGVTSVTTGTWSEIVPASTTRNRFYIHNPFYSGFSLLIGLGTPISVAACSTTSGSLTITTTGAFTGVTPGQLISGTSLNATIPTYVRTVTSGSITISQAATATGSGVTYTFADLIDTLAPGESLGFSAPNEYVPGNRFVVQSLGAQVCYIATES